MVKPRGGRVSRVHSAGDFPRVVRIGAGQRVDEHASRKLLAAERGGEPKIDEFDGAIGGAVVEQTAAFGYAVETDDPPSLGVELAGGHVACDDIACVAQAAEFRTVEGVGVSGFEGAREGGAVAVGPEIKGVGDLGEGDPWRPGGGGIRGEADGVGQTHEMQASDPGQAGIAAGGLGPVVVGFEEGLGEDQWRLGGPGEFTESQAEGCGQFGPLNVGQAVAGIRGGEEEHGRAPGGGDGQAGLGDGGERLACGRGMDKTPEQIKVDGVLVGGLDQVSGGSGAVWGADEPLDGGQAEFGWDALGEAEPALWGVVRAGFVVWHGNSSSPVCGKARRGGGSMV